MTRDQLEAAVQARFERLRHLTIEGLDESREVSAWCAVAPMLDELTTDAAGVHAVSDSPLAKAHDPDRALGGGEESHATWPSSRH